MSLLSELLDRLWPRYHEHGAIASARAGRVVITGVIESLEDGDALACPLSGELAVVVHYVARTRGMSSRAYGIAGDALDIVRRAHEGRDFLLRDSSGAALILVDAGEDVLRLHDTLFEQHGLSLEPDTELVRPGERVRVRGVVTQRVSAGSPHRQSPFTLVVRAHEITRADASPRGS